MESLNLNTLATSLPTANVQNAEKDLLNNFKGTFNTFPAFQLVLITPVGHHTSALLMINAHSRCIEHYNTLPFIKTRF
jgi:hypothetical protein